MDDLIEVLVRESKPHFTTGQYKIVLKDKDSDLVLSICLINITIRNLNKPQSQHYVP